MLTYSRKKKLYVLRNRRFSSHHPLEELHGKNMISHLNLRFQGPLYLPVWSQYRIGAVNRPRELVDSDSREHFYSYFQHFGDWPEVLVIHLLYPRTSFQSIVTESQRLARNSHIFNLGARHVIENL